MITETKSLAESSRVSSTPVKVLHINSGNLYGGVESILVTLARRREQCQGMEPHFALCHEGRLSSELLQAGVSVYQLGNVRISRPWTMWRARRRLGKLLAREHFDLVICHMPWSMAVFGPAVKDAGRKLGFWAHALHTGTGWLERLAQRATPDVAIANSRYTEAGLANLFPGVPSRVIYPPVPLPAFAPAGETRSTLRRDLGVSEDTVVIIQVSRIEACKGHLLHLQALARLQQLPTAWVCWMVGGAQRPEEQRYFQELKQTAATLGIAAQVRFLGQRSDIPELLSAADIFCQPNQTPDSFGISFVESLWAGRPVITTAMGGALEIVDECCGVLIKPGDVDALASALRSLIENPDLRARLAQAGRARAFELCDPARQMKILSQVPRNGNPDPVTP